MSVYYIAAKTAPTPFLRTYAGRSHPLRSPIYPHGGRGKGGRPSHTQKPLVAPTVQGQTAIPSSKNRNRKILKFIQYKTVLKLELERTVSH